MAKDRRVVRCVGAVCAVCGLLPACVADKTGLLTVASMIVAGDGGAEAASEPLLLVRLSAAAAVLPTVL